MGAKRAILTAKVGSGRLTALSLSLKNAKVVRNGLGTTVKGVRAVLSGQAAKALNAAFDTSLFAKGLPIGSVTVKALPAEVEFAGGATTLALDPGAASALASLGIDAAPVDPATAGAGACPSRSRAARPTPRRSPARFATAAASASRAAPPQWSSPRSRSTWTPSPT